MVLAIQTTDLSKHIGWWTPRTIVDRLNLSVEPGHIFGLLGPNGAGKTTTFKLLLGLARISSGQAFLFGRPVPEPSSRAETGYLPEVVNHPAYLSVREYLTFHQRLADGSGGPQEISNCLKRVGLPGSESSLLGALSKGMRQRVDLARVLLLHARLIFLDEPVSGLDPMGQATLKEILQQLKKDGITILINSHAVGILSDLCDEIAIIARGSVVCAGKLEPLLQSDRYRILLAGSEQDPLDALGIRSPDNASRSLGNGRWEVEFDVRHAPETILRQALDQGWHIREAGVMTLSLEQLFTRVLTDRGGREGTPS